MARKKASGAEQSSGAGTGRRRGSLASLSVAELQREIARRRRKGGTLQRRRDRLMAKVHALDAQLAEFGMGGGSGGGMTPGGGRRRFRNEKSLIEMLQEVLKGKTMGVSEVSEAVQKAGYRTSSPSFRTIVNQALIASGKFSRVGRGQYTAK